MFKIKNNCLYPSFLLSGALEKFNYFGEEQNIKIETNPINENLNKDLKTIKCSFSNDIGLICDVIYTDIYPESDKIISISKRSIKIELSNNPNNYVYNGIPPIEFIKNFRVPPKKEPFLKVLYNNEKTIVKIDPIEKAEIKIKTDKIPITQSIKIDSKI